MFAPHPSHWPTCLQVNGVAAIHAEIVKSDVFPTFVEYYAKKVRP